MTFDEYEVGSRTTAEYKGKDTRRGIVYNSLKLAGEAGEIADKVGKLYGKDDLLYISEEFRHDLLKELGDVLWHLTALGCDAGISLEEIAQANQKKLADRQKRGVIVGHGDNR